MFLAVSNLPPLCETARAYGVIISQARAIRNGLLCCIVDDALDERTYGFARIREVLVHFQPRASAVEVSLAVLVHGVERGVIQRGFWLTFCRPLFEQLFGWCIDVIRVNNILPPCWILKGHLS